jgi:transcriptional regulator with XRE-family HTH domain
MSRPAPDTAALGRAVQAIRTERRMSQVQLAEATGFRQSWLSNVEHGRRNPSWTNVVRLAEGLGVRTSIVVSRAERLVEGPDEDT